MRYTWIFVILSILLFSDCSNKTNIDISILNNHIDSTDSINTAFYETYNQTLRAIYKLSEDSIIADSISKLLTLPDTSLFNQFLEHNIHEINKIYYVIQQEIYFSLDQLNGLREDVFENNISNIQYTEQLESQKKMLKLLQERVDNNITVFKEISNSLFLTDSTFL